MISCPNCSGALVAPDSANLGTIDVQCVECGLEWKIAATVESPDPNWPGTLTIILGGGPHAMADALIRESGCVPPND